jgi:hypothetical protein
VYFVLQFSQTNSINYVLQQYGFNVDLLLCRHTAALNWGNALFIRKCWIMYSCILFWALYSCILFWAYPCFGPWRSNILPKLFLLISGISIMWGRRLVQNQTQEGNSFFCTSFSKCSFFWNTSQANLCGSKIHFCLLNHLQRVVVPCNYVRILHLFIMNSWNS